MAFDNRPAVAAASAAITLAALLALLFPPACTAATPYVLTPLPYGFDALEPYIDNTTMEVMRREREALHVYSEQ